MEEEAAAAPAGEGDWMGWNEEWRTRMGNAVGLDWIGLSRMYTTKLRSSTTAAVMGETVGGEGLGKGTRKSVNGDWLEHSRCQRRHLGEKVSVRYE